MGRGRRWATAVTGILLVLTGVGGATAGRLGVDPVPDPGERPAAARADDAAHATDAAGFAPGGKDNGCLGWSGVNRDNPAARVINDVVTVVPGLPPRRIGTKGDVNWRSDPYHYPSWVLRLHNLRWIGSLVEGYRKTGDERLRDRAVTVVQDWIRDNPPQTVSGRVLEATAHRVNSLLCLRAAIGRHRWLDQTLLGQADLLLRHYSGPWNHGLDENIALLGIGCVLDGPALRQRALRRTQALAAVAVDEQGATNEQSVGYQQYNYERLGVAERRLRACGLQPPPALRANRRLMPLFSAHASTPDGRHAQIGDTYAARLAGHPGTATEYVATAGTVGAPPARRVAVYRAGYVFGRSAWRPLAAASHYTLRFGPGRRIHGHDDHMALTWWARGRHLLVDSGHVGYERGPYRAYLRSPEAHNVLTVPTARFAPAAVTTLVRHRVSDEADFFEFSDAAYDDTRRQRSVLIMHDPDVVVVDDRVESARPQTFHQLWHVAPDFDVTVRDRATAAATPRSGDLAVHLVQVRLSGPLPAGSTSVVKGRTSPTVQGWVSRRRLDKTPAPVVLMGRSGRSARVLTLIAPTRRSGTLRYAVTPAGARGHLLTVDIDGRSVHVQITADGDLEVR